MMFTFAPLAVVSALLALVSAQSIDPNSVSNSTRQYWCEQQQTQCPFICQQQTNGASDGTESNSCDPNSLTYSCVCSNGMSPNVSEYSQTMPYFTCTEWGNQCVSNCGQDSSCAHDCRANHPCGAQNPTRINVTSTATGTMTGTASGSGSGGAVATTDGSGATIYSGFGSSGDSSSTGSSGAAASTETGAASRPSVPMAFKLAGYGQAGGVVVLVAAFFGGFAILL